MEEGDFIRITHARVFVPPYAAILPRAHFASYYLGGDLKEPERALSAPVPHEFRRAQTIQDVAEEQPPRTDGRAVVPTLDRRRKSRRVVTFLLAARYHSLGREASLLGNELTIVGKIVYKDRRLPGKVSAEDPAKPEYVDRATLAAFAPRLHRADRLILRRLRLRRKTIVGQVRASLTIRSPVAVVIPVAVYS